MKTTRTIQRRLSAGALSVLLALSMSGCFGDSDDDDCAAQAASAAMYAPNDVAGKGKGSKGSKKKTKSGGSSDNDCD